MPITAAAKKHLAELAGRYAQAEKKVDNGVVTTKTTTKVTPTPKKRGVRKVKDV